MLEELRNNLEKDCAKKYLKFYVLGPTRITNVDIFLGLI